MAPNDLGDAFAYSLLGTFGLSAFRDFFGDAMIVTRCDSYGWYFEVEVDNGVIRDEDAEASFAIIEYCLKTRILIHTMRSGLKAPIVSLIQPVLRACPRHPEISTRHPGT